MSFPIHPRGADSSSRPPAATVLLRPLIQEIVALTATTLPEHSAADAPVIFVDVDRGHAVDADPNVLRRVLATLVHDAVAAAAGAAAASDGPVLREVVITSVLHADAVEVEVADSGACSPEALGLAPAAVRPAVERLGGTLQAHFCPEGGKAVTLRLPRRDAAQRISEAAVRRAA